MDITYKRMGLKTYLVIGKNDNTISGFHEKMITRNRIPYLIRMMPQNIDGRTYYYYDIQGRVNMETLYSVRTMSASEVSCFLEKLSAMLSELQRYLLLPGDIIFDPANIWFSLDNMEPGFIYVPEKRGDHQEGARELAEYIALRADPEDREAAGMAYSYLESVESGDIIPKVRQARNDPDNGMAGDGKDAPDNGLSEFMTDESWKLKEGVDEDMQSLFKEEGRGWDKGIGLFVGLGVSIASCVLYVVWVIWPDLFPLALTEDEYMIFGVSVAVGFAIVLVLSLIRYNRSLAKKRAEEGEIKDRLMAEREEDPVDRMDYMAGVEDADPSDERTMLLRRKEEGAVNDMVTACPSLTSQDGRRIVMKHFPFILGKMKNRVDEIIEAEGISRLHAMIKETDGKYYLSDLNSLNGTYLNGEMLMTNSTAEISDGDVISLADISFTFQTGRGYQVYAAF